MTRQGGHGQQSGKGCNKGMKSKEDANSCVFSPICVQDGGG